MGIMSSSPGISQPSTFFSNHSMEEKKLAEMRSKACWGAPTSSSSSTWQHQSKDLGGMVCVYVCVLHCPIKSHWGATRATLGYMLLLFVRLLFALAQPAAITSTHLCRTLAKYRKSAKFQNTVQLYLNISNSSWPMDFSPPPSPPPPGTVAGWVSR